MVMEVHYRLMFKDLPRVRQAVDNRGHEAPRRMRSPRLATRKKNLLTPIVSVFQPLVFHRLEPTAAEERGCFQAAGNG